jgi:hypothetical protein
MLSPSATTFFVRTSSALSFPFPLIFFFQEAAMWPRLPFVVAFSQAPKSSL